MVLLWVIGSAVLVVVAARSARRTYGDLGDSPRWAWPITGGPGAQPPRD